MYNKSTLLRVTGFFLITLLLVALTFYNSLYRMATTPHEYSWWVRVHAVSLLAWVIVLFIQPLLIYSYHNKWHRYIGLFSIGVVLLIIITTTAASLEGFRKVPATLRTGKNYSILFSQLYGMLLFAVLYARALLKAKVFSVHMQCIMASLIVILGPVIFRSIANFQLSMFGTVEQTCNLVTYGILNLLLLVLCLIESRKKESFGPYVLTMAALVPVEVSQIWFCY